MVLHDLVYDPQVGQKEKYMNLRSQCYYLTCMDINDAALSIMNCDPVTKQRIIDEFAAIKVFISEAGVVSVSSKDDLKSALGTSPDLSDTIMMKKYRDLILITEMEGDLESISGVY
jgi:phage terminase large subunit